MSKNNLLKKIFIIIFIIIFIVIAVFVTKIVYNTIYENVYQNQIKKQIGIDGNVNTEIKNTGNFTAMKGTFIGVQKWFGEVNIVGDVVILSSLEIEPGTKIIFAANKDEEPSLLDLEIKADGFNDEDPTRLKSYTDTHSSLFIVGSLSAKGTKENPIIFTSNSNTPHYADWGGINLVKEASILEHVIVEYSRNGISIPSNDPNMEIKNSVVKHALWGCFSIDGSNGLFENNLAQDCGHEGFDVGGKSIIKNNKVINSHASIVVLHGSPTITGNTFQDEIHSFPGSSPLLENNKIDHSLRCKKDKRWDYGNYRIPCFGEPYLIN